MSTPERPITDRWIVARVLGCTFLVFGVPIGGVALMYALYEGNGGRVDLSVTNHAATAVDVSMDDSYAQSGSIIINGVAPGKTVERSKHLGFVGRFVVRVRVGQTTYQGEGGPLLDDNGPHRLDVQVRDDGVDLMRGRASYEMRAALPETRPVLGR